MKTNKKKNIWYVILASALVLTIITFTPLILSPGKINPTLFSLPYTLWSSMAITILLVILTFLASRVQEKD